MATDTQVFFFATSYPRIPPYLTVILSPMHSTWWNEEYVTRNAKLSVQANTKIFFSLGEKQERKIISPANHFLELAKGIPLKHVVFPTEDGYGSIPKSFRYGLAFMFAEK